MNPSLELALSKAKQYNLPREVVEKALIAMVKSGYFCEEEAIVIAQKLLRSNAIKIYDLKGF